ncbi:MAG TPA: molybdenum cofactor biosynthesis protein MoaE [Bryobacteraceae bacterium]|jgi:molybdopterin synthase catalytic subunit|nr:molybdenum cofactor biosynthesis protein MoaE [Bryobacteraceae bacterium]
MRVRVLFFGVLRDIVGRSEEALETGTGATVANVWESYAERFATLREKRPSILFARNREFSRPETALEEGDEVAFLPPVSGGAGHIFAITRDPLDARALAKQVERPEDGAVVTFEGVVRNNSNGRATAYLEYEAYEEMALVAMTKIGYEIAAEFAIGRIGIVHRLGRVEIGEPSVVIVATAPHRRAAFEAAHNAIDRLKREVPIWKKEIFSDGAEWVEGQWADRLLAGTAAHVPR